MIRNSIALVAPTLAAAPELGLAQQTGYHHGGHMWDGGWWMFLGPLWMIVVIGVLVAGVVLLVRWLGETGPGQSNASGSRALDLLKERYAKGEIDTEEFEERRRALGD